MKLSKDTLSVLDNFAKINSSMRFKKGNVLRTVSEGKIIIAEAVIGEKFPSDFAIYDLVKFLGVGSLFSEPEYVISDDHLEIKNGNKAVKYIFAEPSMILDPDKYKIALKDGEIQFDLNKEDYDSLLKAASVLSLPDITVVGNKGKLSVVAKDKKDKSAGSFSVDVKGKAPKSKKFEVVFNVDNLKLLPGNYKVSITKGPGKSQVGVGHFQNGDLNLQYWVVTEANSTYGN